MVAPNGDGADWRGELKLGPRDYRRATKWIERSGGIYGVSQDAWLLTVARIRTQFRARMLALGIILIVGVPAAITAFTFDDVASRVMGYDVLIVAVAVGFRIAMQVEVRRSLALVSRIGTRTTRGRTPSIREILGTVRWIALGAVFVAQLVLVGAICFYFPARYGLGGFAAFAVEWLCIAWLIGAAARRPAVGIDPTSLAIDERMRANDAGVALILCYAGGAQFIGLIGTSHGPIGLAMYAVGVEFLGLGAQLLAQLPRTFPLTSRRSLWRMT